MQRVKRATAVAVLPAAPGGGTPGYFNAPAPGGGVPATVPGYEWYNGVQEEIMAVIEGASIAPDETRNNQLARAIQSGKLYASAAGGTANAVTGTFIPAIDALINGMGLYVRAASANTTTTPTFTPASGTIAAKAIVKGAGAALAVGDIAGAGHWIELQYDQVLDKWVLLNPATGVAAGGVQLNANNTWTKGQRGAISTLTYAATVTPDFNTSNNFSLPLTGNTTLANPTNLTPGQSGSIAISQDATGSRTMAFGAYFKFISGSVPSLTTTASAVDVLTYYVVSATQIYAALMKDVK